MAGNKSDLEEARQVRREEAEEYAASIGASFMETSAKDKTNVDELFANISKALPCRARAALQLSQAQREELQAILLLQLAS